MLEAIEKLAEEALTFDQMKKIDTAYTQAFPDRG